MVRRQGLHNISSKTYHVDRHGDCDKKYLVRTKKTPKRSTVVTPVSNLPKLKEFDSVIPSELQFEMLRLQKTVRQLEYDKKALNDKIGRQQAVIQEALRLWELGLSDGIWPTLDEVRVHVMRLENALKRWVVARDEWYEEQLAIFSKKGGRKK